MAKFSKELSSNTNPKKAPRLLNRLSEDMIRALGFIGKLKHVTDQEFIDRYIEAVGLRPRRVANDAKLGSNPKVGNSRPTSTRSGCL